MTNYDFDESHRRAARDSASEGGGEGEHEYFDHLRALSLSVGERIVVFLVLALLAGVSVAGYMTEPGTSPQTTGSISAEPVADKQLPAWPNHDRCNEASPYGDRGC